MSGTKTHTGTCFCGAVEITVSGDPVAMGYCHCSDCRLWSAGPVNAFTLWDPKALKVTKGEQHLAVFNKTPKSFRQWCKLCGGHLFTQHPGLKLVDVYAAVIPQVPFKPSVHVFYQERVLPILDGLPKMKDMPKEMGGSGVMLPEA